MLTQKKKIIGIIIGGIVLFSGMGYVFVTSHHKQLPQIKFDSPTPVPVPNAVKNLIKDVGKKLPLPADETPTVATVTDVSKLNQAFFLNAEKGDKILMFITSKQAFLYRPSTGKIINKGTLEIITDQSGTASESAASASAKQSDPSILRVKF